MNLYFPLLFLSTSRINYLPEEVTSVLTGIPKQKKSLPNYLTLRARTVFLKKCRQFRCKLLYLVGTNLACFT